MSEITHVLRALQHGDPGAADELLTLIYAELETAEVLGVSVITAKREWAYARAWLHQEIAADQPRFLE